MKNKLITIIEKYLKLYPKEIERQNKLLDFLKHYDDNDIIDWNNFDGHIVASGFIYAKKEKVFLVLYHNDLKMYLYPGGHIDKKDNNPLETSKREILEETGLSKFNQFILDNDKLIPFDIDTHMIEYNERLNLPKHYHFDFRYLFVIEKIEDIKIDIKEISFYQWININKLSNDINYGKITQKLKDIL